MSEFFKKPTFMKEFAAKQGLEFVDIKLTAIETQ